MGEGPRDAENENEEERCTDKLRLSVKRVRTDFS